MELRFEMMTGTPACLAAFTSALVLLQLKVWKISGAISRMRRTALGRDIPVITTGTPDSSIRAPTAPHFLDQDTIGSNRVLSKPRTNFSTFFSSPPDHK